MAYAYNDPQQQPTTVTRLPGLLLMLFYHQQQDNSLHRKEIKCIVVDVVVLLVLDTHDD
jgi:hypothetical protein